MSVPLDRLYNFLFDIVKQNDILIYRFFPHGSRKISDLTVLNTNNNHVSNLSKVAFFHDQEPLNFDLYAYPSRLSDLVVANDVLRNLIDPELLKKYSDTLSRLATTLNLKVVIAPGNWIIPSLLVHSEQRSSNLDCYESNSFIGVYWWCHAIIARDWFRYAQHDPNLNNQKTATHDFLIYNRAWTGTREYRLKFIELLIQNKLKDHCMSWFNPVDDGHKYQNHKFKNSNLQIENFNLQESFDVTLADSSASADYCATDYQYTNVEVVLETLFDDDRLHLTEKILRPIACAQPFMLAATHGSLEYLRSYGFETFSPWIDESYDSIEDPAQRLEAIVQEMKRIANLSDTEKTVLYAELRDIAIRNKKLFFSDQWQQAVVGEFKQNFNDAYKQFENAVRYPV